MCACRWQLVVAAQPVRVFATLSFSSRPIPEQTRGALIFEGRFGRQAGQTKMKQRLFLCLSRNDTVGRRWPVNAPLDAPLNVPRNAPRNASLNAPLNAPRNAPLNLRRYFSLVFFTKSPGAKLRGKPPKQNKGHITGRIKGHIKGHVKGHVVGQQKEPEKNMSQKRRGPVWGAPCGPAEKMAKMASVVILCR